MECVTVTWAGKYVVKKLSNWAKLAEFPAKKRMSRTWPFPPWVQLISWEEERYCWVVWEMPGIVWLVLATRQGKAISHSETQLMADAIFFKKKLKQHFMAKRLFQLTSILQTSSCLQATNNRYQNVGTTLNSKTTGTFVALDDDIRDEDASIRHIQQILSWVILRKQIYEYTRLTSKSSTSSSSLLYSVSLCTVSVLFPYPEIKK